MNVSFSKVYSVQNNLLKAQIVDVECDVSSKVMNRFDIVGLGDKAIEEAKERISASIKNCGLKSPKSDQTRTTISLAPADIKKTGPIFDLAMAICFLKATKQITFSNIDKIFIGELALNGQIREVKGVLPMIVEAKRRGFKEFFIPINNTNEASLVSDITIYPCKDLVQVISHIDEKRGNPVHIEPFVKTQNTKEKTRNNEILLEHIKGNENAKRALTVALAGGHNVCFYGPPGTGKTMLAKVSQTLLPKLSTNEIVEVTSIYSVAGELENIVEISPFRAPHHTSSYASIVGGGADIKPGEISLSHKGVLFLDEFPEFDRRVINSLRQPLEDNEIKISRTKETAVLPADFILMISLNPCPCGFYGYDSKNCSCSMNQISKYQKKISGPIMDRVDIWVEVSVIDYQKLIEKGIQQVNKKENKSLTQKAQEEIINSRRIQLLNNKEKINREILNGRLSTNHLEKVLDFEDGVKNYFDVSAERLRLSARSYTRILKVALTISQMKGDIKIKKEHLLEALSWRPNSKFFV